MRAAGATTSVVSQHLCRNDVWPAQAAASVVRQSPIAALLGGPRVRFVQGDGRRLLAASSELYEIIEADPIRPDTSHSGMLYSKEFMEQARRRLAPGGLFVQWAPTRRVVATFTAVFPYAVLLRPGHILVGSDRPIQLDLGVLAQRLGEPAVLGHFQRGNPGAAADVTSSIAKDAALWQPRDRRDPAPPTDMFPYDEVPLDNRVGATWRLRAPPPRTGGRADHRPAAE